jgi:chemotaxis protein MotB
MEKRERNINGGQDTGAWMVTFSDLVMLLLTFFVLLLTMSSLDQSSLKELSNNLQGTTGVLEFSGYSEMQSLASIVNHYNKTENVIVNKSRISKMILPALELAKKTQAEIEDLNKLIDISDDERGLVVSFQDNVFFEPGRAIIKKESLRFLDTIADVIATCSNNILIMGHTDNTPTEGGTYASNWELSVYRGLAVLEYFVDQKKINPPRFFAGGYGSTRPLHPNEDPRKRALNRRVEIIFKNFKEI